VGEHALGRGLERVPRAAGPPRRRLGDPAGSRGRRPSLPAGRPATPHTPPRAPPPQCAEEVWDTLARRALEIAGWRGLTCATWVPGPGCMPGEPDRRKAVAGGPKRVVVVMAGVPGSGKTTTANAVVERICEMGVKAQWLPMDGFHYSREQLDRFPDPHTAHQRRGSHWTFDAKRFVSTVRSVRRGQIVRAPSFDHREGDPVEQAINIDPDTDVVIVEGNYVLMPIPPWDKVGDLADETWFTDVDLGVAMARVHARQVRHGASDDEAGLRIDANDRLNGRQVLPTRDLADVVVPAYLPIAGRGTGRAGN